MSQKFSSIEKNFAKFKKSKKFEIVEHEQQRKRKETRTSEIKQQR